MMLNLARPGVSLFGDKVGLGFFNFIGNLVLLNLPECFLLRPNRPQTTVYYLLDSERDLPAANMVPKFYHDEGRHYSILTSCYFA